MSAQILHGEIARRLNRKAQQRAFLRLVMPWAGSVALVVLYGVMEWPL